VTVTAVGAVEVVPGVAVAVDEATPLPAGLIAVTRNAYVVPFVRPVTVAVVPIDPVFAIAVVHVTPPSVDCSTT
jgi:hypothetical protein